MTREDFEEWFEENKDEALGRIESDQLPLTSWIRLFGKALRFQAEEADEEEEADDDYGDADEPLDFEEEM